MIAVRVVLAVLICVVVCAVCGLAAGGVAFLVTWEPESAVKVAVRGALVAAAAVALAAGRELWAARRKRQVGATDV
ncbi:hypothetical protein ACIBKY_53200 [Nonomuraea sp. NPDC050394]|uniref:hypothetical protein n=1 Tax=Nonomuraea sp. NPDC050394 TaxID=3364363 RepID=UPI0037A192CA